MKEFYKKLVDLYAGSELPVELSDQMEIAASQDPELSWEMASLKQTVEMIHDDSGPEYSEETYQRILNQIYLKAGAAKPAQFEASPLQYRLPISI